MILDLALTSLILVHVHGLEKPRRFVERHRMALRELATLSLPYLDHASRWGSPTMCSRATDCLTDMMRVHPSWFAARMLPVGWPSIPWADMLPEDFPDRASIQRHYMEKAGDLGCYPDWSGYRLATQLLVTDLLESGWSRQKVQQLLNNMRDVEIKWIIEKGSQWNPPVHLPRISQGPIR